jgi:hypothetical protein
MRKSFFEICHGCNREVHIYEHHWRVRLAKQDKPVFFHNGCYRDYVANYPKKVSWAEEKYRV